MSTCKPTRRTLVSHRLQEENGNSFVEVEVLSKGGAKPTCTGKAKQQPYLEALVAGLPIGVEIMDYSEHAIGAVQPAKAAAPH